MLYDIIFFMKSVLRFIKNEIVLVIAAVCAVISSIFVHPSKEYLHYIDWSVIILLFCLMAVVAGFKETGVFDWLTQSLLSKTINAKSIGRLLVLLSFFLSMFITNDVALITIVPLTIGLFKGSSENRLIFIIVMETVAANLGSIVTPIGNPQNLYLFSAYNLDIFAFFRITLPLGTISLALIIISVSIMKAGEIKGMTSEHFKIDKVKSSVFLALFVLCLFTVLRVVNPWICLFFVLIVLLIVDRSVVFEVDYLLLLTFICFFVLVGNIARVESINGFISKMLAGNEIISAVLISQVISNVPAAVMLSSFTDNAKALLIGTNIGGLGTLVASLASLISYKLYCSSANAKKARYLVIFSTINFAFLAVLLAIIYGVYSGYAPPIF